MSVIAPSSVSQTLVNKLPLYAERSGIIVSQGNDMAWGEVQLAVRVAAKILAHLRFMRGASSTTDIFCGSSRIRQCE